VLAGAWRPDAVLLFGYPFRSQPKRCCLIAVLRRIPNRSAGGSHNLAGEYSWSTGFVAHACVRMLFRTLHAALAVPGQTRLYLRAAGIQADRIVPGPPTTFGQSAFFRPLPLPLRREAQAWRQYSLAIDPAAPVVAVCRQVRAQKPARYRSGPKPQPPRSPQRPCCAGWPPVAPGSLSLPHRRRTAQPLREGLDPCPFRTERHGPASNALADLVRLAPVRAAKPGGCASTRP